MTALALPLTQAAPLASAAFLLPKEVLSLASAGLHTAGDLLDWLADTGAALTVFAMIAVWGYLRAARKR